jgi:hypothetical protein
MRIEVSYWQRENRAGRQSRGLHEVFRSFVSADGWATRKFPGAEAGSMDGRHFVKIWSVPLLVAILCAAGALPARADDFPIMVQGVTVDAKSNTVTPIGSGPFTALLKSMNLPATPNAFAEGLGSSKFNLPMFDPIKTGSVGDALGTLYVNVTKFPVSDIEVTMNNLTDTFAGSMGTNGSWNVMVTAPDAQNNKPATLTITAANNGSAIQPNQYLWLMVPAAPSDSNPKKPDQFTMKLTPTPPPPAPPAPAPPAKQAPAMGTGGPGANMSYGAGTGTLTFTDSTVNLVRYLDGSTTTTNGPAESIIGSTITVQPMTLIGPDPQVPGAYDFADTLVQVTQGSTLYMSGTLSDIRIYPTSSVPGDSSELVGTLSWEDTYPGLGSRYLSEDYAFSELDDLFIDSNLINVTDGFLQDGSASGPIEIASVSVVPEPSTVWLVAVGMMALVTRSMSLRRSSQSR